MCTLTEQRVRVAALRRRDERNEQRTATTVCARARLAHALPPLRMHSRTASDALARTRGNGVSGESEGDAGETLHAKGAWQKSTKKQEMCSR